MFEASRRARAARRGLQRPAPADAQRTVPPVRGLPGDHQRQRRTLVPETLEGFDVGVDWTPGAGPALDRDLFRQQGEGRDHQRHHRRQPAPAAQHRRDRRARGSNSAPRSGTGAFSLDASLAYTDARAGGQRAGRRARRVPPVADPEWAASATASYRPAERHAVRRHAAPCRQAVRGRPADRCAARRRPRSTCSRRCRWSARSASSRRAENLFDEDVVTRNQGGSMDLGAPRTVLGRAALRVL